MYTGGGGFENGGDGHPNVPLPNTASCDPLGGNAGSVEVLGEEAARGRSATGGGGIASVKFAFEGSDEDCERMPNFRSEMLFYQAVLLQELKDIEVEIEQLEHEYCETADGMGVMRSWESIMPRKTPETLPRHMRRLYVECEKRKDQPFSFTSLTSPPSQQFAAGAASDAAESPSAPSPASDNAGQFRGGAGLGYASTDGGSMLLQPSQTVRRGGYGYGHGMHTDATPQDSATVSLVGGGGTAPETELPSQQAAVVPNAVASTCASKANALPTSPLLQDWGIVLGSTTSPTSAVGRPKKGRKSVSTPFRASAPLDAVAVTSPVAVVPRQLTRTSRVSVATHTAEADVSAEKPRRKLAASGPQSKQRRISGSSTTAIAGTNAAAVDDSSSMNDLPPTAAELLVHEEQKIPQPQRSSFVDSRTEAAAWDHATPGSTMQPQSDAPHPPEVGQHPASHRLLSDESHATQHAVQSAPRVAPRSSERIAQQHAATIEGGESMRRRTSCSAAVEPAEDLGAHPGVSRAETRRVTRGRLGTSPVVAQLKAASPPLATRASTAAAAALELPAPSLGETEQLETGGVSEPVDGDLLLAGRQPSSRGKPRKENFASLASPKLATIEAAGLLGDGASSRSVSESANAADVAESLLPLAAGNRGRHSSVGARGKVGRRDARRRELSRASGGDLGGGVETTAADTAANTARQGEKDDDDTGKAAVPKTAGKRRWRDRGGEVEDANVHLAKRKRATETARGGGGKKVKPHTVPRPRRGG